MVGQTFRTTWGQDFLHSSFDILVSDKMSE